MFIWSVIHTLFATPKAESLTIISVGQRPTERDAHANQKPQRGAINPIHQNTKKQLQVAGFCSKLVTNN